VYAEPAPRFVIRALARSLSSECIEWHRAILGAVPGEIGCKLRNAFYGYHAGPGCRVLRGVIINFPDRLVLGRNVGISPYSQLNAAGGIEIGDDTLVGPACMIWSVNHRFRDVGAPIRMQGYDPQPIVIERDCWIAGNVVILPGLRIGAGSVVAAGAVVTRSCEPHSVLAGVPAKRVGSRVGDPVEESPLAANR
jgi:maltose O-acetyltransferase